MPTTSDPNELMPLTQLGSRLVQERIRKVPEFATSTRWSAAAIVLQLTEGMGFLARVGFELCTPLDDPFQDVITAWGGNQEDAVRAAVKEWLDLALPAAVAIHSNQDVLARLGEIPVDPWIYSWRLSEGPLRATGPDADTATAELRQRGLFERLALAAALPLQREVPWFRMKLRLARDANGTLTNEAWLNNAPWPQGLDLLQRFALPGQKPLEIMQYVFLRPTGKRPARRPATAPAGTASDHSAGKKPWWKVW
jgi:hypothetical protein